MIDELRTAILELLDGRDLSIETMRAAVGAIMDGRSTEVEITALLTALRCKGGQSDSLSNRESARHLRYRWRCVAHVQHQHRRCAGCRGRWPTRGETWKP
jgi:hypothetical protein